MLTCNLLVFFTLDIHGILGFVGIVNGRGLPLVH